MLGVTHSNCEFRSCSNYANSCVAQPHPRIFVYYIIYGLMMANLVFKSSLRRNLQRLFSSQSKPYAPVLSNGRERVFVVGVGMTKFQKVHVHVYTRDTTELRSWDRNESRLLLYSGLYNQKLNVTIACQIPPSSL